jgi:2-keto-4-pentenoate hydratase/2-oxohepta-3-ene-1,7-dioic acid hydratase in catechol pathway
VPSFTLPALSVAPFRLSGVVYGTLLNHRSALKMIGDAAEKPPDKGFPNAPVLYAKPRSTVCADGDAVVLPPDASEIEVGATVGTIIGRPACRVHPARPSTAGSYGMRGTCSTTCPSPYSSSAAR